MFEKALASPMMYLTICGCAIGRLYHEQISELLPITSKQPALEMTFICLSMPIVLHFFLTGQKVKMARKD